MTRNRMNRIKIISMLALLLFLMAVAGEVLIGILFKGYVGKAHLAVPVFFFVFYGSVLAFVTPSANQKGFIKQYMAFKTLKLLVALVAVLALGFAFRNQAKGMLVNFLIYYLATMIFESAYVLYMKKHLEK